MYVRGYLQGSENGRVVTIDDFDICLPFFKHLSRDYEKSTITAMYHGFLTTLSIIILLKRLFYNTRFILFSNACKYVFMPLTKFIQHGNDELLTTTYI